MTVSDLVEKIKSTSPKVTLDGQAYYIVEMDHKLKESELQRYATGILHAAQVTQADAPDGLVAATIDGKPMRWEIPVVLTWAIDEASFSGHPVELAVAKTICDKATEAWNSAANALGILDSVRFAEDGNDPIFQFKFEQFENPSLYALAFFPNDTADKRFVHIGPTTFLQPNPFDQVGVIRHELGHILGFRHEHIRSEAQAGMTPAEKAAMEKWVTGGMGGEALSKYDSQSVMHYPLNGQGTLDFQISELDKAGFQKLYTLPNAEVREFPI